MKHMTKLLALLLACTMLAGCGAAGEQKSRQEEAGEELGQIEIKPLAGADVPAVTDFGLRLFQKCHQSGENTLLSPLSVFTALAMTANGAAGDTYTQMEQTLGASVPEINAFLGGYQKTLGEKELCALGMANAIWLREDEGLTIEEDFLRVNTDHYGAKVERTPFDAAAVKGINDWVKENTGGMIPEILDEMAPGAVMYLVNALAFDAKWQEPYNEYQLSDGVFHSESGYTHKIELMHSREDLYLESETATGFIKYYEGQEYAFAALLPKEGVDIGSYIASLDGKALYELLSNPAETPVDAAIPQFEAEYEVELSSILSQMGMRDAFDRARADFSAMGSYHGADLYLSRVLHKTHIAVDKEGTKAGAATVVEDRATSAIMEIVEPKTVVLDRPFVYMLIDCENCMPVFIGAVESVGSVD